LLTGHYYCYAGHYQLVAAAAIATSKKATPVAILVTRLNVITVARLQVTLR